MTDIKREPPPKFIVNPSLAPICWIADPWQLRAHKNPNYLNSVWLGTVNQMLTLPSRLWMELLLPLLMGRLLAAVIGFFAITLLTPGFLLLGLTGYLRVVPLTLEVICESHMMSMRDARRAIECGMTEMLVCVTDLKG